MPPERSSRSTVPSVAGLLASRGVHLFVGALALAFSIFAGIDASRIKPTDGTVWKLGRPELVVVDVPVRDDGEVPALERGDRILGIANRIVNTPAQAAGLLMRQAVGDTVSYLVDRGGLNVEVPVKLYPNRVVDRGYLSSVLLAVVYASIGLFIYLKSRNDMPSRLFWLLCVFFTVYFMTNLTRSSYFWGDLITQNGGALARFLLPPLFLHFFLVFPEKKHALTRHPFLAPLLYLLPAMFYLQFTVNQFFGTEGARIDTTHWLILGCYFIGGLTALLHGYFNYQDPLQKIRVRILTLGTLLGVLPFLVFKIGLEELLANTRLAQVGVLPLAAIPVSFGYCIARYRVMQTEFFLRRGLVHSVMTGLVILIYFGLVLGIGGLVLQLSGPTNLLVTVGVPLGVAAVLWPARARVQAMVDRRFLGARQNLAAVIEEFSKEIPRIIQRDDLLQRIGGRLCGLLELPSLGFYFPRGKPESRTWSLSAGIAPSPGRNPAQPVPRSTAYPPEISLEATVRIMEKRLEPFWVEPPPAGRFDSRLAITREQAELVARFAEQEILHGAGIVLLVPLAAQGRLVGLLAVPTRPGAEVYDLQDIQLLTIVAGQMALQLENSRLYEEEVAKQKLEEELAMARTIQSRLLPRTIPTFPGIELDAVNISSRQVSGDYYDMILKEDGCLGIVIADVSGKGMPASLLASSLQAALRAQCDTGASPGAILERVNRQLHASTDPQHFATLFLCVFDPRRRRLIYSSGGHNAPVVVHGDGGVELLEAGGLPLGAFDFGTYDEDELELREGDLFFLYTDGLTETKDPREEEEYGEERLQEFLRANRDLPVDQLIQRVKLELRQFSGRDEADDDITLIVLKVVGDPPTEADQLSDGARATSAVGEPA